MLQLFKDFINEHGSTDILRERILLIQEQFSILEKKVSVLESENSKLKLENQNLKDKIAVYEKPAKKSPKFTFNSGQILPRNMI